MKKLGVDESFDSMPELSINESAPILKFCQWQTQKNLNDITAIIWRTSTKEFHLSAMFFLTMPEAYYIKKGD